MTGRLRFEHSGVWICVYVIYIMKYIYIHIYWRGDFRAFWNSCTPINWDWIIHDLNFLKNWDDDAPKNIGVFLATNWYHLIPRTTSSILKGSISRQSLPDVGNREASWRLEAPGCLVQLFLEPNRKWWGWRCGFSEVWTVNSWKKIRVVGWYMICIYIYRYIRKTDDSASNSNHDTRDN